MIDFKNGSLFKLSPIKGTVGETTGSMFVEGEEMIAAFKSVRDKVVFTNKRIIAINVQGITGKKIDYTSLPYSKVQVFSVETSGVLDNDCEIDLYFSGLGMVRFEITSGFDVVRFNRIISQYVLN